MLDRLLKDRPMTFSDPKAIADREAEQHRLRVVQLRREAGLPDRANRFLRDSGDRWLQHEKTANTRKVLAGLLTRLGGATAVVYGPQGTGKTVLAVDLIRTATDAERHCQFTTAVEMIAELSDAKIAGRLAAEMRRWVGVDVLVVDQFDKMARADWEVRLIFDVLDRRHNTERVTVLVLNGDHASVASLLGDSLVERCTEAGAALCCGWASFRG